MVVELVERVVLLVERPPRVEVPDLEEVAKVELG